MNKADISELFEYNQWAKGRLLASLQSMKSEDFEKNLHSSHGGIKGTLLHMVNAAGIWTNRLVGKPTVPLKESDMKTLSDFKAKWDEFDGMLSEILEQATDENLDAKFDYQDSQGNKYTQPRLWALNQLFNHFTYHRGQIVVMQRQMGYTPVNTDMIAYYRAKGK